VDDLDAIARVHLRKGLLTRPPGQWSWELSRDELGDIETLFKSSLQLQNRKYEKQKREEYQEVWEERRKAKLEEENTYAVPS
jgi:hypothetical protein